jgi:hypothetical protein
LADHTLLRVGELALSKGNSPDKVIQVQHISVQDSAIQLLIKYSKTDQCGLGTTLAIPATRQVSCPVVVMTSYLQTRPSACVFI